MKVLLIEDEKSLAQAMAKLFEQNHILVDVVYDGLEGEMMAEENMYDVIILDLMLPYVSGLEILKNLRNKKRETPVLILTAMDSTKDKVKGLDLGADDYMVKPFETEELMARVRALGRRPKKVYHNDTAQFSDVSLDMNKGVVMIGERPQTLTAKELQLLEMFIKSPGVIISKEQIIDRIWGLDSEAVDNSVEIYIHYLRKKLADSNTIIQTKRGLGYVFKEK
ncbi:MAG TPA: DNA-binding response regulator [Eubacteriaceae bacterium]|nr:DNA-binding response regulator [Eubacteriaceae bacterium]